MILRFLLAFLVLGMISFGASYAEQNGISGRTASTIGCGGGGCHSSSSSTATTVTVTSASGSFTTTPGGKLELTVVVAHASQRFGGFNLAIKATQNGSANSGGTFTAGSGTKVLLGEMTHSSPKTMSAGQASFSFTWTAPNKEGTFFLQAVGNAANGLAGAWNWATPIPVVVKAASGVDETPTPAPTLSLYPNPASSNITLNYTLPAAGAYQFMITDAAGRTVYSEAAAPEIAGEHSKQWNGRTLDGAIAANGQYFAILRSSDEHTVSIPFTLVR
ncbi:MAG: choice-of-anchor V domain-containing protein [Candidatus Kapaibacterium sp.]